MPSMATQMRFTSTGPMPEKIYAKSTNHCLGKFSILKTSKYKFKDFQTLFLKINRLLCHQCVGNEFAPAFKGLCAQPGIKIRTQNINHLLANFSILKTSTISPISISSRIFRMHTLDGNPNEIHIDGTNAGKNPHSKY
jgi:hypothetical protein